MQTQIIRDRVQKVFVRIQLRNARVSCIFNWFCRLYWRCEFTDVNVVQIERIILLIPCRGKFFCPIPFQFAYLFIYFDGNLLNTYGYTTIDRKVPDTYINKPYIM